MKQTTKRIVFPAISTDCDGRSRPAETCTHFDWHRQAGRHYTDSDLDALDYYTNSVELVPPSHRVA